MKEVGQNEGIANIAVDSMIWSQQQSASQNRDISVLQIYTVSKNIKNPQILEHIKPDYGSLGQFMKNVAISKDILLHNRKKKNELQDDIEQKKMRATLKDKNLDKVIKQPTATHLQKTIASKMIVENLFQNKFGTTLQNFCSQNNKHQSNNHNYSSIAQLTTMFDDLMTRTKDESIVRYSQLKHDLPVLTRNKNQISAKQLKVLSYNERYEKLKSIQKNYLSLKKLTPFQLNHEENSCTSITYQSFVISQPIKSYNLLAAQLVKIQLSKVKSIKLINVNFSYDIFSAFLDYFTEKHCYALRQLVIQKSMVGNCEKVALRVKQFIENTLIYRVELPEMGFSSRDFCMICLGVGSRNSFGQILMRDNKIGEIAKKCLDVLLKFNKEVKLDLTNNPIQKQIKGKPGYNRCFV